jgi:hypothetical protein
MSWASSLIESAGGEAAPGADLSVWSGKLAAEQAKTQKNELLEEGIGLPGSLGLIGKVASKAIDTIKTVKNVYTGGQ